MYHWVWKYAATWWAHSNVRARVSIFSPSLHPSVCAHHYKSCGLLWSPHNAVALVCHNHTFRSDGTAIIKYSGFGCTISFMKPPKPPS